YPLRDACRSSLRGEPPNGASTSTGTSAASQSCVSCGDAWNPHPSFPVSGSIATIAQVHWLSPGRAGPFSVGVGFPVPTNNRVLSGSYVPVIHICPPVAPPLAFPSVPGGGVL